jgi:hypothetical protein
MLPVQSGAFSRHPHRVVPRARSAVQRRVITITLEARMASARVRWGWRKVCDPCHMSRRGARKAAVARRKVGWAFYWPARMRRRATSRQYCGGEEKAPDDSPGLRPVLEWIGGKGGTWVHPSSCGFNDNAPTTIGFQRAGRGRPTPGGDPAREESAPALAATVGRLRVDVMAATDSSAGCAARCMMRGVTRRGRKSRSAMSRDMGRTWGRRR